MSRESKDDYALNFAFHLVDVSDVLSLLSSPGLIASASKSGGASAIATLFEDTLGIMASFSNVSATGMTVTEDEFKPLNRGPVRATTGYDIEQIILSRGVISKTSDMYKWIDHVINGDRGTFGGGMSRKNLILFHVNPTGMETSATTNGNRHGNLTGMFIPDPALTIKAWSLWQCKAVGYKPHGDLDALGESVSIAELTIRPEDVIEWY